MHERDKDEIRYHIDEFLSACIHKDWAAVGCSRVPNWRGFSVRTQTVLQGGPELVAEVKAMLETSDLVDYEMVEIDYVFHGATCLVPYVARLRGRCGAGRLFEIKLRALDVYVNQGRDWLQVAGSVSLHPDSMADPQLVAMLLGRPESALPAASS
jgi:hypothetical protein